MVCREIQSHCRKYHATKNTSRPRCNKRSPDGRSIVGIRVRRHSRPKGCLSTQRAAGRIQALSRGRSTRRGMMPVNGTVIRLSPGKGRGLFASQTIPKGSVVVEMDRPARLHSRDMDEFYRTHPWLPHDAVIHAPRSPLLFYDASWARDGGIPRWYRLNHSSRPNTAPRILNPSDPPRQQRIGWVSTETVPGGRELTFRYENTPPEWAG